MKRVLILVVSAAAVRRVCGIGLGAGRQGREGQGGLCRRPPARCVTRSAASAIRRDRSTASAPSSRAAEIKEWLTDPVAMTAKTKAERKPAMKLTKPLPAEDVDALVAYLSTLKKK